MSKDNAIHEQITGHRPVGPISTLENDTEIIFHFQEGGLPPRLFVFHPTTGPIDVNDFHRTVIVETDDHQTITIKIDKTYPKGAATPETELGVFAYGITVDNQPQPDSSTPDSQGNVIVTTATRGGKYTTISFTAIGTGAPVASGGFQTLVGDPLVILVPRKTGAAVG